jgi:hypothetical protein
MITILIIGVIGMLILGAVANGISDMAKGVDKLSGLLKKMNDKK